MTFIHRGIFTLQDKYLQFTPHFMLRKCSYEVDSTECTTNCIHKGRYCAVDSIDDAFAHKFQGWQVSCRPNCFHPQKGCFSQ